MVLRTPLVHFMKERLWIWSDQAELVCGVPVAWQSSWCCSAGRDNHRADVLNVWLMRCAWGIRLEII